MGTLHGRIMDKHPPGNHPGHGTAHAARLPRTLADLHPDQDNANAHTERGQALLEETIRAVGLGRGILADRAGNIIAGNGTLQAAIDAGLTRVISVPLTGNEILVGVRIDLDLESAAGRQLALADNGIAQANRNMDPARVAAQADQWGLDLGAAGISDADLAEMRRKFNRLDPHAAGPDDFTDQPKAAAAAREQAAKPDPDAPARLVVVVLAENKLDQVRIHRQLVGDGYEVVPLKKSAGDSTRPGGQPIG